MSAVACFAHRRIPGRPGSMLAAGHAGSCLRCQAEEARRRRLGRELRALRQLVEPAPGGFVAAVMATLDGPAVPSDRTHRPGRRIATGGALAAAAVGAALVALRKGRPAVG